MSKQLKIGITGGIGSGKSTVARIFEVLGIPVYYADDAAKRLMNENAAVKEALKKAFGTTIYVDEKLDRSTLAKIVFNDAGKLKILNHIVHPATIQDANEWMQTQVAPYTIKEAALIFESGMQKHLDYIIGVHAPTEMRIRRVMQRDHLTKGEVMERMNKQIDEDTKMKLCDFVIINNEQQLLVPRVIEIHHQLTKLSENQS